MPENTPFFGIVIKMFLTITTQLISMPSTAVRWPCSLFATYRYFRVTCRLA